MYDVNNSILEIVGIAERVNSEWESAKTKDDQQKVIMKLWKVIDIINDVRDDLITKAYE